ncbi:MAG: RNA polymerase subunit sigma [Sandaracinus sp.]|nr:RNA polymerase subunit sigma [Sandaracinus sp.]
MLAASPIALPFPSTGGELRLPSLRVPEGAARVEGEERHGKARLRWERKLIRRTLQGDERAFGELYRAYAPGIFARVLMPRLGNRQAAEDALAETFRTAFERLHTFEQRELSISSWLGRIAANKATDMHRVKQRTARALTSFEQMLDPLRPAGEGPADALEAADELQALRAAIAEVMERLNPRYRQAIELRFMEEKSREACAEELAVKVGTFDVVILRALRAFRREWDKVRESA